MVHDKISELARQDVALRYDLKVGGATIPAGTKFRVEDWWDRVSGGTSWMRCEGNPACLIYAMRTGFADYSVPLDDEMLYGKIGCMGYLVHISEIA